MTDDSPQISNVVALPVATTKDPITEYSPQLDAFEYYLMDKHYTDSTIRSYTTALLAGLKLFTHSAAPEQRINETLQSMSRARRAIFKSAWGVFYDWLAPRGYPITFLPKVETGRPRKAAGDSGAKKKTEAPVVKPPIRCGFRGYGDLFEFRDYLKRLGFGELTVDLYFRIIADALHFLEGDTRASAETICAVLGKAARRFPHVDPTSVRFLRAWAHLADFWRPLAYEVTVWERPRDMEPKKFGAPELTPDDTEKKDTQQRITSSPEENAPLDEF